MSSARAKVAWAGATAIIGLGVRAPLLAGGFAPTDEGFLPGLAWRMVHGQVPYRDFYARFPPFGFGFDAILIQLLGAHDTVLLERWVASGMAAGASVIAMLTLARWVSASTAFWAVLPTAFLAQLLYPYLNYTAEGNLLGLAAVACFLAAVRRGPMMTPWLAAAGALAAVAAFCKPTYALLSLGLLVAVAARGPRRPAAVAALAAGSAMVLLVAVAWLAAVGGAGAFLGDSTALIRPGQSSRLTVFGGLAELFLRRWQFRGELVAAGVAVALFAIPGLPSWLRGSVPLVGLALVAGPALAGEPTLYLQLALVAVTLLGLVAVALTVASPDARERLFPPELPLLALLLQLIAQYTLAPVGGYWYVGGFLSVPVAILVIAHLATRAPHPRIVVSRFAAPTFAIAVAAGAGLVISTTTYMDAPRGALTAHFSYPPLVGLASTPANVAEIEAEMAAVTDNSRPGDPVLMAPDFPGVYRLTGRVNPAPFDWWHGIPADAPVDAAIADLDRNPPVVVLLERDDPVTAHPDRGRRPVDWSTPGLARLRAWVLANYRLAAVAGNCDVYLPAASASTK